MKGLPSLPVRELMRTKNIYFIVFILCMLAVTAWIASNPGTNIQNVVSSTHRQIGNIKRIPSTIRHVQELKVDPHYLEELGFNTNNEFVLEEAQSSVIPVVGTSVSSGEVKKAARLIKSVEKYLPQSKIVIFDLGLGSSEAEKLNEHCNQTKQCQVKQFEYDKYPSHVQYLDICSYRPICIQELLKEHGAAIWADTSEVFITGKINKTLTRAQKVGIAAWTVQDSTSSLTHSKMFNYFKTKQDNYYFIRAVESSHLFVYNTEQIHKHVMLPWVKCALIQECISPLGAQSVGCNLNRKPRFMYSGCHRYDMSVLNVILGMAFNDFEEYASEEVIFGALNPEWQRGNLSAPVYISKLKPCPCFNHG